MSPPSINNNPRESDDVLLQETGRVLQEQVKIIQAHQTQATRALRVLLTGAGLILTVLSIIVSVTNPSFSGAKSVVFGLFDSALTIVMVIGLIIYFGTMLFLLARALVSGLGVLSPVLERSTMRKLLLYPIFASDKEPTVSKETTLRPGLDGDAAKELINSSIEDSRKKDSVIRYNIGCISYNEDLIESNRWHLRRMYRSMAFATISLGVLLILGLDLIALESLI